MNAASQAQAQVYEDHVWVRSSNPDLPIVCELCTMKYGELQAWPCAPVRALDPEYQQRASLAVCYA
jgi:hypothetical protein